MNGFVAYYGLDFEACELIIGNNPDARGRFENAGRK